MKFLVINGPNLNMMHFTEPGVAGQLDYNGLLDYLELCCTQIGMEVEFFQSNHEGDLIDEIQSAAGRADGLQQPQARLGRRDAARRASEQPQLEALFQPLDRLAQCRLRHAQLDAGPGEAALPRDHREGGEVVEDRMRH